MTEMVMVAILQTGAVGGVLVWHLWKTYGQLQALTEAQNRTTRAILMLSLQAPSASRATRQEAQLIYDEMSPTAAKAQRDAQLERRLVS